MSTDILNNKVMINNVKTEAVLFAYKNKPHLLEKGECQLVEERNGRSPSPEEIGDGQLNIAVINAIKDGSYWCYIVNRYRLEE